MLRLLCEQLEPLHPNSFLNFLHSHFRPLTKGISKTVLTMPILQPIVPPRNDCALFPSAPIGSKAIGRWTSNRAGRSKRNDL